MNLSIHPSIASKDEIKNYNDINNFDELLKEMQKGDKNFDKEKFNKYFKLNQKDEQEKKLKDRNKELKLLNKLNEQKKLHELSIGEIMINMSKTFFSLFNDLLNKKTTIDLLFVDNRLFYIGLFMIIVFALYAILNTVSI